jgi:LPXTG-motif cell wall-anchored protein
MKGEIIVTEHKATITGGTSFNYVMILLGIILLALIAMIFMLIINKKKNFLNI